MAFLDKNAIFRHNIELEAIARQSVEASREVICAYFGNIDRNSGYFLLRIFLSSHPNVQPLAGNTSRCCHNPGIISVFNYYQLAINMSRRFKSVVVDIAFESSSSIVLAGVCRPLSHCLSIESRFRPPSPSMPE